MNGILDHLSKEYFKGITSIEDVISILDIWINLNYMIRIDNSYLALAIGQNKIEPHFSPYKLNNYQEQIMSYT